MKILFIITGCIFAFVLIWFIYSLAQPPVVLGEEENEMIHEYLERNIRKPGFGGQYFSSFRVMKKDKENIYLWFRLQEYYNGRMGSGSAGPIALTIKLINNELEILTHEEPRDGDYYPEDIKKIFPKLIHAKIFNFPSNLEIVEKMGKECENRYRQSIKD